MDSGTEDDSLDGLAASQEKAVAGHDVELQHAPVVDVGEEEVVRQAMRREFLSRARAVLSALRKRDAAAGQANAGSSCSSHDDTDAFSFGPYTNSVDANITHQVVTDVVFHRHAAKTDNANCHGHGINASKLQSMRRWTLWRYQKHRTASWQRKLAQVFPLLLLCVSMQIKWDETQQLVHCYLTDPNQPQAPGAEHVGSQEAAVQLSIQVMSSIAYLKTSNMARPWPWILFPLMLERTTAECIYKAWFLQSPLDLKQLPSPDIVRWIWIVFVCDQASSNKRFQAYVDDWLVKARTGILTCDFPCIVHIIHRCLIPLLCVERHQHQTVPC